MLLGSAILMAGAQKANVDAAKKLAGKVDKIEEARALINQALANPETANKAATLFTAGKIEFDAFSKLRAQQAIDPNSVDPMMIGDLLLRGYDYYVKVPELDLLPNEKGQVKPAFTKDVVKTLAASNPDYFEAGANFFNGKRYYPEAYNAFMIYADMPEMEMLGSKAPVIPDTVRATAYFNAGLAAWSGNEVPAAATAFKKARLNNYPDPQGYIFEIACWQNMAQNDSTLEKDAEKAIYEVAEAGYNRFGLTQPIFLNNMINSMVLNDKGQDARALLNEVVAANPGNAAILGLRGFVEDRLGDEAASEADYRAAAALPDVDFETLKNAAKKVFRLGAEKWNNADQTDAAVRNKIKTDYFEAAKAMAEKARTLKPDDSEIDYILENVNYQLDNYFK